MTKQDAVSAKHGDSFHHVSVKNSDGTPARCRVTGACKTWKRDLERFKLPVKHGMYDSFYLEPFNAEEWLVGYGS